MNADFLKQSAKISVLRLSFHARSRSVLHNAHGFLKTLTYVPLYHLAFAPHPSRRWRN